MDTTSVIVTAVLVLALVVLAVLFRKGKIRAGLKGPGGTGLEFEGENPAMRAARTGEDDPGKSADSAVAGTEGATERRTEASGAGSVAIGGSANQAKINTKVEREK